jgi:hypothetical protein
MHCNLSCLLHEKMMIYHHYISKVSWTKFSSSLHLRELYYWMYELYHNKIWSSKYIYYIILYIIIYKFENVHSYWKASYNGIFLYEKIEYITATNLCQFSIISFDICRFKHLSSIVNAQQGVGINCLAPDLTTCPIKNNKSISCMYTSIFDFFGGL